MQSYAKRTSGQLSWLCIRAEDSGCGMRRVGWGYLQLTKTGRTIPCTTLCCILLETVVLLEVLLQATEGLLAVRQVSTRMLRLRDRM